MDILLNVLLFLWYVLEYILTWCVGAAVLWVLAKLFLIITGQDK